MAKRDYLLEAAKQIRMALDREVNEDYEAAFSYYKNGVDLLLNGVQLDPNKDRREAVKRKTTQYLKRAEEIFISHLQDNLGKGSSHLGGYSSLRFRPIRHLSSPVEDLDMCKVVGVVDKVMVVQSMVNKETFVVKSLVKSSWESRDQPTIIPQGVPYMVKLLRYYVSEDAVYLHLEHLQGGRLFSKLHKVKSERAKEHPECFSTGQNRIKMKNSYTSPSICTENQQNAIDGLHLGARDEGPVSPPTSWDETLQRLDACGTHSYIEETGCLQNRRSSRASLLSRPERPSSLSGPAKTPTKPHVHPPAPSLCLHPLKPQERPALPLACARVNHTLDVMADPRGKTTGMGLIECSSDFELAWNSADPARGVEGPNPYAAADTPFDCGTIGPTAPLTSPAILHLAPHCQTQIPGTASWVANGFHPGPAPGGPTPEDTECSLLAVPAQRRGAVEPESRSPTTEERTAMVEVKSTDRAVFSEYTDAAKPSASPLAQGTTGKQGPGAPMALTGVKSQELVEEAWELVSPGGKDGPPKAGSVFGAPWTVTQSRRGDMDAFLKSEGSEGQGEDQSIEVDGWCHLPRFPQESSKAKETAVQVFWGLPEKEVRVWGAQILLALESLHQQGILCRDLNPRNVLLTSNGKVSLSFFGQWSEVQSEISSQAVEQMYCAPEIGGVSKITEACDWWSLGALLFELLTGMPLWQLHPAGIYSHTQLLIPDHLSTAAASLLTELLQFDAGYRLGSGGGGVSDIKCHPFFSGVSWKALGC
ncbi:ribosomal protein S6 kinase-like 1 isoform X1 [Gadus morhua]|uniref:Ribosomal protein S6 kinase like 1 n=2 Tax=Gadus morhua TaxID=8049 RepID=A0A8C4ZKT8_GADMO|nr:ribosomal protein S6 kinase-like 1 isoform X1 [Gadus morhua]XP_030212444.1 ribosomal protein S6 kinase-like 1 isoform X1 [Gadus morhua]XP_030212445.1 ribosomal protein S6 kinase-like 1 isoform X1 [Gadus morhua]